MKQTIVGIPVLLGFLLTISSVMLFAEGGSEDAPKNTSGNTIDQAISYQGDYIVRRSPENSSIAIVQVTSTSENLSKYIIDELPIISLVTIRRSCLLSGSVWIFLKTRLPTNCPVM